MRKHYVYVLFRETGEPFYVGMGQGDRIDHHLHRRAKGQSYRENIARAVIAKLGDLPRVKVAEGLTVPEAQAMERALILALGRHPHGPLANMTDGGEGPINLSPETLAIRNAKIGEAARARADQRGRKPAKPRKTAEEARANRRAASLAVRANPEKAARVIGAIRLAVSTPEARALNSERTQGYWDSTSEEDRRAHGDRMVKALADPNVRAKMRASAAKRWARA